MKRIPRRGFLKRAGQASAAGYLAGGLAAAPARIVIIADPADKLASAGPVHWAIGEFRRAVETKGATSELVATAGAAGQFQTAVVLGRPETNLPAEAFRPQIETTGRVARLADPVQLSDC